MSEENVREKSPYGTALVKSAEILNTLADSLGGLGVSDLARQASLNKGTVHKLLETLQSLGWVSKQDGKYELGIGLLKYARAAVEQLDVARVSRPYLEELNALTEETVHLGVEDEGRVLYVVKLESPQTVRMYSSVGKSAPLHCTGIGKALLASFSETRLSDFLAAAELSQFTSNTLIDTEQLRLDIEQTRQRGYAMDDGEHEEDVRCVAVPLTRGTTVYGAISVSAPKYRFGQQQMERFLPLLLECSRSIVQRLGEIGSSQPDFTKVSAVNR